MALVPGLLLIAGIGVLVGGAELLVRGASGLGRHFGISPLVIGLTVVAFGTSAPEIAVSLRAIFGARPDLAIGNAIGSNIFNVLLILGLSALVRPLVVEQRLVRIDVPIMLVTSAALWPLLVDGRLGRTDGLLLFTGFIAYTALAVRVSRRESRSVRAEYDSAFQNRPPRSLAQPVVLVATGLAGAVLGARWLVQSSVVLATAWGVSELIIGLTIVAAGTSLPELATSLVAALRGQRYIAVGNVVGSNIFNALAILGIAGLVAPEGADERFERRGGLGESRRGRRPLPRPGVRRRPLRLQSRLPHSPSHRELGLLLSEQRGGGLSGPRPGAMAHDVWSRYELC